MTINEAYKSKIEAEDLAQNLRLLFLRLAIPIAQNTPFSDIPVDLKKLRRVIAKAEIRAEFRGKRWADMKWPNRIKTS